MDEGNTNAGDGGGVAAYSSVNGTANVVQEVSVSNEVEVVAIPTEDPALPVLQTTDPDPSIQGPPLDNALPVIQVSAEPQIVERIVEKIVEKEVIKEVLKEIPVEKIVEKEIVKEVPVEKIVYRDTPPVVCPPPTDEEREAIKRDFLIELSHEGTAVRHELMLEKLDTIMALFNTKEYIMREDVMDVLDCSGTTATRLLTELRHEGKIVLHGTGGNGATYTKNS